MSSSPIQYVKTSDDVRIAYISLGDGPPLVFASTIFGDAHNDLMGWPAVRVVTDRLVGLRRRVVRYDHRGMGSSDRNVEDLSLEARIRDITAVVGRLGLSRFALTGIDIGAATAVAYAVRNQASVSHLVLLSPWASGARYFAIPELRVANSAAATGDREWNVFAQVLVGVATAFEDGELTRQGADNIRQSTSPAGLAAYKPGVRVHRSVPSFRHNRRICSAHSRRPATRARQAHASRGTRPSTGCGRLDEQGDRRRAGGRCLDGGAAPRQPVYEDRRSGPADAIAYASGNQGILDQIAALTWVRDNVATFGGDADKVTIFGNSAGSLDASVLMTSPLSQGLFRRVIAQSGSVILVGNPLTLQQAEQRGERLAADWKMPAGASVKDLRAVSVADILRTAPDYLKSTITFPNLGITIDGYVVPRQPIELFATGTEHHVGLMHGNTSRDSVPGIGPPKDLNTAIEQAYRPIAQRALKLYVGRADPLYGTPADQWATDTSFRCSAVAQLAWYAAAGNSTFEYEFARCQVTGVVWSPISIAMRGPSCARPPQRTW